MEERQETVDRKADLESILVEQDREAIGALALDLNQREDRAVLVRNADGGREGGDHGREVAAHERTPS